MQNTIKLILFDIGAVLNDYSEVFKTVEMELSIPKTLIDETFDKYDESITKGYISPQEFYILCVKEHSLDADPSYDFIQSWIKDYKPINQTHSLAKDLKAHYKVGLLSNIYKGLVPLMKAHSIIPNINYDHEFLSCDIHMQKPEDHLYDYVLEKTGLSPHEILFIDDKAENIAPAIKKGWQTCKFSISEADVQISYLRKLLLA